MKQANLLIELESLRWVDANIDRSSDIEDFMLAHNKAFNAKDKIFNHPEFWLLEIEGINFIGIMANHRSAIEVFQWLKPDHRAFIIRQLMNHSTTPNAASSFEELEAEDDMVEQNNGLLNIGKNETLKAVFDVNSWFLLHINYIKRFPEFINWEPNDILPYFEYSNSCIFDLVSQLTDEIMEEDEMLLYFQQVIIRAFRSNAGDLIELATEIANRNGYSQNQHLSNQERQLRGGSRRLIFDISKNNQQQYLSLDFENGQFEACDESGRHIGVFNFSGNRTGQADTSGNHDIWTLSR